MLSDRLFASSQHDLVHPFNVRLDEVATLKEKTINGNHLNNLAFLISLQAQPAKISDVVWAPTLAPASITTPPS